MIASPAPVAISPAKFARVVGNLAATLVHDHLTAGTEWEFFIAFEIVITAFVPEPGVLVISHADRVAIVRPGGQRRFEITRLCGHTVLGETRGVEAAVSIALDYVVEPVRAAAQHDHDAFAV